jgi:hypothetical protein
MLKIYNNLHGKINIEKFLHPQGLIDLIKSSKENTKFLLRVREFLKTLNDLKIQNSEQYEALMNPETFGNLFDKFIS